MEAQKVGHKKATLNWMMERKPWHHFFCLHSFSFEKFFKKKFKRALQSVFSLVFNSLILHTPYSCVWLVV